MRLVASSKGGILRQSNKTVTNGPQLDEEGYLELNVVHPKLPGGSSRDQDNAYETPRHADNENAYEIWRSKKKEQNSNNKSTFALLSSLHLSPLPSFFLLYPLFPFLYPSAFLCSSSFCQFYSYLFPLLKIDTCFEEQLNSLIQDMLNDCLLCSFFLLCEKSCNSANWLQ